MNRTITLNLTEDELLVLQALMEIDIGEMDFTDLPAVVGIADEDERNEAVSKLLDQLGNKLNSAK